MAYYLAIDQFQSTRPRGARQGGRAGQLDGDICFNPRARVGRDGTSPWLLDGVPGVSIHAPAWGATTESTRILARAVSFNPRARVGRDGARRAVAVRPGCFNPRARVGRDVSTAGD